MNWVMNIHNHSTNYLNPRPIKRHWNLELHSIEEKKRTHNNVYNLLLVRAY